MKTIALKLNKVMYYGWYIVMLSGVTLLMSSPGQTYSISVFINAYQDTFDFSSTMISSAYSIATIISGLSLIFMGKMIDRFGARRMLIIVAIMLAITAFYNSFVTSIYMVFAGFVFLRYFGQGSMTLLPSSLVPQWFEKKRAFAMSLSGIGGFLATLGVPAFNLWLITQIGWQQAWRVWGVILLVGFLPLVYLFAVNRPEDIGLTMDNDSVGSDEDVKRALETMERTSFTLKEAIRTKEFWMIGMIGMVPSMFTTGLTFHFFTLMELKNVSNTSASLVLGLIALPSFLSPFLARPIVDQFKIKYILSVTLTMIILSMLFLILGVSGLISAIIFMLFYGLALAVQILSVNVVWPNYFGRKYLGSIRGTATVFMVIGSALGPLPFGINYDFNGNYTIAIIGMVIFTSIALLLSFFIHKPKKTV
ncbi:MAG: MFS transporter [Candidatus Izimaplasma sp.]|nr:MFS transporter [Candidatus Izimaplasma bacterium]